MGLRELAERLAHRPAQWHTTVPLPDPDAAASQEDPAPGYFQVRLTDMLLCDARIWNLEVAPATFFLADFNYGGQPVRRPFFVSNQLLTMMPAQVDPGKLRVRFRDTLAVGPTPYAGGDVGLFVGLFQCAIEDHRKALFSVFETMLGGVDPGLLSQQVKLADKLSEEVFRCLAGDQVECMLAERRVIGQQSLPPRGYLAYLHARKGPVETNGLMVVDGTLQRKTGARVAPVTDLDYCLVRVEQQTLRNDYSTMAFHRTYAHAREKMREAQAAEAQALLLECVRQIEASPDLSEYNKFQLIEMYQADLFATRALRTARGTGDGAIKRSETVSPIRQMQARAARADDYDDDLLAEPFDQIARLTTQFIGAKSASRPLDEAAIAAQLQQPRARPDSSVHVLVRALAAGSIAV